ncbi:amidohydrolase family protein [Streptomyces sp. NPDC057362]|uniref:amidohydrolase family protein n=1 Tax=Streptomyces sp. NPDC057362 TaxID=3346106 RepID=UPI00363A20AA
MEPGRHPRLHGRDRHRPAAAQQHPHRAPAPACVQRDYGLEIVAQHPSRFGLLAALPTDDAPAALEETRRVNGVDGWAMTTVYNGRSFAEPHLDPLWERLDSRHAVVFVHPNAYAPSTAGLPTPLIEVAFDTGRTITGMLYAGVFNRYPNITFVIAHWGVACTTTASAKRNLHALHATRAVTPDARAAIPTRATELFPEAARRAQSAWMS